MCGMNGDKLCGCGRRHSRQAWATLPRVGQQLFEHGEAFELRNCPCGSTLVWPIDFDEATAGRTVYLSVDFQAAEAA